MLKIRKSLIIIMLLLFLGLATNAQDLHFSQWFNSPLTTNPANTGFIPDADYRLGANYRNQWSSIMAEPYRTMSVWGDAQVMRDRIESGWLGLGGVILHDVAGAGSLSTTEIYGSIAYHQMLGYSSLLSIGFNTGWVNKNINNANLKFPDQFDGMFFDAKMPTSVVIDKPNANYFDMQVGMNYAFFPNKNKYINVGFSVQHLNQAKESFFSTEPVGYDNRIRPRYIGFVNCSFKTSDLVIINPMGYYTNQAGASEAVAGLNVQYNLSGDGDQQIIGGLYYRVNESVIPMVGFVYKNIRLMFTYDVTTSSLKQYNNGNGAWEFAVIRPGDYDEYNGDRHQSLCPTFRH
ncbi:MAG TPA: PorP/SprF family type IX secretion system membrane protein [Puia sp.]|nr:PorP/SprF family type IX secretion system membrane protein [Puia sp.]